MVELQNFLNAPRTIQIVNEDSYSWAPIMIFYTLILIIYLRLLVWTTQYVNCVRLYLTVKSSLFTIFLNEMKY